MLPEFIVIFSCLKSIGCSESSAHYFWSNPIAKYRIKETSKEVENFIGPSIVRGVGPILYVLSNGTGTISIDRHFSAQISTQKGFLIFKKEF